MLGFFNTILSISFIFNNTGTLPANTNTQNAYTYSESVAEARQDDTEEYFLQYASKRKADYDDRKAEEERLRLEEEARKIQEEERARLAAIAEEEAAKARQRASQQNQPATQPQQSNQSFPVYGDWERLIRSKCNQKGCNSETVIKIMWCESGGRSNARNGFHIGLFQQNKNFWPARAKKYGLAGASIYDPQAQIHVATSMIAGGGISHWQSSISCWRG